MTGTQQIGIKPTYGTANNRLARITTYPGINPTGGDESFTTTYTHDVNNPDGTMVVTHVELPDGSSVDHEYDSHIGAQTVNFGFRTKSTRTGPNQDSLVTFDVDYEFFYEDSNHRTSVFSSQGSSSSATVVGPSPRSHTNTTQAECS